MSAALVFALLSASAPRADAAPESASGSRDAPDRTLRLMIETPEPEAVVGGEDARVFVSGRALAVPDSSGLLDVILVIDQSKSTAAPSGADVDGDGRVGQEMGARSLPLVGKLLDLSSDDPGDSILAAEVAAAQTLLEQLDPERVRVGIVAFSGDGKPDTRDAFTAVPLTSRYDKVVHGLARLLDEGPHGRTNLREAVEAAVTELVGELAALSDPRPEARKVALLMTDGQPTLPIPRKSHRNVQLAVDAARRAADRGFRFDTFAIGAEATEGANVLREIAAATAGRFTAVEHPRDLIAVFQNIDLADIERVEVRNVTQRQPADHVFIDADGRFAALVPLADGDNWVEVTARSTRGEEVRQRVQVRRIPDAPAPLLTARMLQRRTRLLETELERTRKRRLAIEVQRSEQVRRELESEIREARGEHDVPARAVEVVPER